MEEDKMKEDNEQNDTSTTGVIEEENEEEMTLPKIPNPDTEEDEDNREKTRLTNKEKTGVLQGNKKQSNLEPPAVQE
eukprot:5656115-Ditylum_brightwellii.AAC.1